MLGELLAINYPITQLLIYPNNVYEIVRTQRVKLQSKPKPREGITEMTKKSLITLMATIRSTEVKFWSMLTLTYPKYYPRDGALVKSDLNALLQKLRRDNFGHYLWFLEFQIRGAPHFHILTELNSLSPRMRVDYGLYWTSRIAQQEYFWADCPAGDYDKEVLKMARFNCHEKTWELIRDDKGARNYVMKYAAKEKQKQVPKHYRNVGRFWGASRGVKPDPIEIDANEMEIRDMLRINGHWGEDAEIIPKHIWF